jgi:hypothetical protein
MFTPHPRTARVLEAVLDLAQAQVDSSVSCFGVCIPRGDFLLVLLNGRQALKLCVRDLQLNSRTRGATTCSHSSWGELRRRDLLDKAGF